VTRSHKINDRDHTSLSDAPESAPRYFGKSGPVDADPKKTKKDGGGKGNWYVMDIFPTPAVIVFLTVENKGPIR
jgi:hypothetical protein